jgi:hypothetical protein
MVKFTQLLLEQKNAAVLGALLCAYGTCRVPKSADEPEPQPVNEDEGDEA